MACLAIGSPFSAIANTISESSSEYGTDIVSRGRRLYTRLAKIRFPPLHYPWARYHTLQDTLFEEFVPSPRRIHYHVPNLTCCLVPASHQPAVVDTTLSPLLHVPICRSPTAACPVSCVPHPLAII